MSNTPLTDSWLMARRERAYRSRWIGIGALLLAHGSVDFVLASKIHSGDVLFVGFLTGVVAAQLSLIALWAVLVDRPLSARLMTAGYQAYAMALAVLFGLKLNSRTHYTPYYDWQTFATTFGFVLLGVGLAAAALALLRSLYGQPRLTLPQQRATLAKYQQIPLWHLLRDVAIISVLLTLTRQVLPRSGELVFDGWTATVAIYVLFAILANVLLVPPLIGICFCPREWGMARGMLALLIWPAMLAYLFHYGLSMLGMAAATHGVAFTAFVCAGLIFSFGVSIAVLRTIGFELRFPPATNSL